MVSLSTAFRYAVSKVNYAVTVSDMKNYRLGPVNEGKVYDSPWKYFFLGRLTYLAPTKGAAVLLIRKIPLPDSTHVSVGDSVFLKDPENAGAYLVQKLAAIEGYEVSKGDKGKPYILKKNECWVLTDHINPKQGVRDSRSFGPVPMSHIFGRVIYILRTAISHGLPNNSRISLQKDKPILEIELDVDEMVKTHKTIIERGPGEKKRR